MPKQNEKPAGQDKPIDRVGKRFKPWAVFLTVIAVVLVADLGLKAWCFGGHAWEFWEIGESTVHVRTAEAGGPEVVLPEPSGGDWLPAHQPTETRRQLTADPSVVPRHEPITVIPGGLNLQLTLNTGAVFGTGQGGRPIFITVSILATGIILVLLYRSPHGAWFYQVGLAMILGGALGNLYDRVRFSAVRDMLHMLPSTKLWPWIFNPADVALVVGVGLVLVVSYLSERKAAKQNASPV